MFYPRNQFSVIIHIFLLFSLLFSGINVFSTIKIAHCNPYTDIDVATAYNMITNGSYPNLIILDVRTQNEYDERHLENSILIPVTELESRIDELSQYKDTEIIVYCRTDVRSAQASNILESNNFTKVFNMLGGINAWESAGYQTVPLNITNTSMFPTWLIIAIFLIATFVVIILLKKKQTLN
jgi:rhodanese-related sulfurtransferase